MSSLPIVETGSDEPLYNIGVVTRMTGISMATLRAWERRYNFPESQRTAGGHRLYSERDILRLRWVKSRIDDGMQTAQAINALRHQEQTGHVVRTDNGSAYREEHAGGKHHEQQAQVLYTYQERLFDALAEKQIQRADEILGEALVSSTPEDLILNVIGPTLNQIGDAWEEGKFGVATEHLATNYLRQRLLMWMVSGPPAQARPPIILACAPTEWHEGSLLIMGALLRRRRYPVVYLGQAVPLPDLAGLVRDVRPSMVVLVAMTEEAATELAEWPNWLPETAQSGRPIVGFGGRVFRNHPEWRHRMAGVYLGDTFQEGISTIERLLA